MGCSREGGSTRNEHADICIVNYQCCVRGFHLGLNKKEKRRKERQGSVSIRAVLVMLSPPPSHLILLTRVSCRQPQPPTDASTSFHGGIFSR